MVLALSPIDHLSLEGLGTQDELIGLCQKATRLGLLVIADVVFNHMAVPNGVRRGDWQRLMS